MSQIVSDTAEHAVSIAPVNHTKRSNKALTYFILASLVVFIATGFFVGSLSSNTAHAQEIEVSQDVELDTTVDAEDLEVNDPAILPGSFLYGFKNAFRGIQSTLAFNEEAKAKLHVKHASQRALEAAKLLDRLEEKGADEEDIAKAQERAEGTLDAYQRTMDRALEHAEGIEDPEKREDVLEHITDKILRHDRIIEKIESDFEGEDANNSRVLEHKNELRKKLGRAFIAHEGNPEEFAQKVQTIVDKHDGSEFKHFKVLEVLEDVQDRVDEHAQDRINLVRDKLRGRFEDEFNAIPEGEREMRFKAYIDHLPGNAIHHLEVLDEVKAQGDLPPEAFAEMERMKQIAAEKFLRHVANAPEHVREDLLRPLAEGDEFENLRVVADLKDRVPVDELPPEVQERIAEHEQRSVQKFREAFADDANAQDVASRAEALMEEARRNPSPATFKALEDLEKQLTPEQREFVRRIEAEGAREIARKYEEHGEEFFNRISTHNPEDLELFEDLGQYIQVYERGEYYQGGHDPFAKLRDFHVEALADHVEGINDPEEFERLKEHFDEHPDVLRKFNQRPVDGSFGKFDRIFDEKEGDIEAFKARMEEEMMRHMEMEALMHEDGSVPPEFGPGFEGIRHFEGQGEPGFDAAGRPLFDDHPRPDERPDFPVDNPGPGATFDDRRKREEVKRFENGQKGLEELQRPHSEEFAPGDFRDEQFPQKFDDHRFDNSGSGSFGDRPDGFQEDFRRDEFRDDHDGFRPEFDNNFQQPHNFQPPPPRHEPQFHGGPFPTSADGGLIQPLPGEHQVRGASTMWETAKKISVVGGPLPNIKSKTLSLDVLKYFFQLITFTYNK